VLALGFRRSSIILVIGLLRVVRGSSIVLAMGLLGVVRGSSIVLVTSV